MSPTVPDPRYLASSLLGLVDCHQSPFRIKLQLVHHSDLAVKKYLRLHRVLICSNALSDAHHRFD
jgi:hypothetical protein